MKDRHAGHDHRGYRIAVDAWCGMPWRGSCDTWPNVRRRLARQLRQLRRGGHEVGRAHHGGRWCFEVYEGPDHVLISDECGYWRIQGSCEVCGRRWQDVETLTPGGWICDPCERERDARDEWEWQCQLEDEWRREREAEELAEAEA